MSENDPLMPALIRWLRPVSILFFLYAMFFLPFWKPLLLAFFFSCALAPVINSIRNRIHTGRKITSLVLVVFLLTAVILAVTAGGLRIFAAVLDSFQNSEDWIAQVEKLRALQNQVFQWLKRIPFLSSRNMESQANQMFEQLATSFRDLILNSAKALVVNTPDILLNFFVFLAAFGSLLVWGDRKWFYISKLPGLGSHADQETFRHFERVCAISIGSIFLTGFAQAVFVAIGAALTGFQPYIFFLIAFIASLIPVLGAASVPVFMALASLANGALSNALILVTFALMAGTADNIIRAWLFSKAANTNPIISLLALLGGLSLFGFTGLFMAPIVEQLVMYYSDQAPRRAHRLAKALARRWKGWKFTEARG